MISRNDIIDLLTLATVYDQRNADEADVRGWLAVAEMENWTAAAAQRVVIEHYSRGADRPRINPAAITDRLREARRKAAASFVDPDVPEEITGREYPAWYRAQRDAHIDRMMDAWAGGEPIPEPSAALQVNRSEVRELTAGINLGACPPELREQITKRAPRIGRRIPREEAS